MPELPEVQAHAERIEDDFAGATLAAFPPQHPCNGTIQLSSAEIDIRFCRGADY